MKNVSDHVLRVNDIPMWYVVQVYAGFEKSVIQRMRHRAMLDGIQDDFADWYCAVAEEDAEKKPVQNNVSKHRSFYPGYIFIKMKMNNSTWSLVSNTTRVVSFVGTNRFEPSAMTDDEFQNMIEDVKFVLQMNVDLSFSVGDVVRIKDGSFASLTGIVSNVDVERKKVLIMLRIFDRETALDLDWTQVEKV